MAGLDASNFRYSFILSLLKLCPSVRHIPNSVLPTTSTQSFNGHHTPMTRAFHASDEIENLKKKHAREVMDLEMDVKKCDRGDPIVFVGET